MNGNSQGAGQQSNQGVFCGPDAEETYKLKVLGALTDVMKTVCRGVDVYLSCLGANE